MSPTQVFLLICLIALCFAPAGAAWGKRSFGSVIAIKLFPRVDAGGRGCRAPRLGAER
jgi:hypothetical protein